MESFRQVKTDDGDGFVREYTTHGKNEFFGCICGCDEHTIRVNYFVDEFDEIDTGFMDDELYISIQMSQYRRWYQRIWPAIKYIFGYQCKYGHWDNWALKVEDAKRFQVLLDKFINSYNKKISNTRTVNVVENHGEYVILSDGARVNFKMVQ